MRQYITVDLKYYVDPATIMELTKSQYSHKASQCMQSIFYTLLNQVKSKDQELKELKEQISTLESALQRQQRYVIQSNEAKDNPGQTREDRVWELSREELS